jgi:phosphoribosylglycinamide formyltransferase-1
LQTKPLLNLAVDLDERFSEEARSAAVARIEALGVSIEDREGADDRTLAWIDLVFGGTWSNEAFCGANAIARRGTAPVGFATYGPRGLRYRWLREMGAQPGIGIFGPFGVASEARKSGIGPELLTLALCGLRRRGYATALIPAVGEEKLIAYYMMHSGARVVERFDRAAWEAQKSRVIVMASGEGTNVEAVAKRVSEARLAIEIAAVVVNKEAAGVIERAERFGVSAVVLPWNRQRESRASYNARLRETVEGLEPELVLLLGWMHLLDASFVGAFPEIVNLHPAFMPLDPARDEVGMPDGDVIPVFRGPHAVRDAVVAGARWIGASVHRVTADTDRGPVIARMPLKLTEGEDADSAHARLRPIEHALVPRALMAWRYER